MRRKLSKMAAMVLVWEKRLNGIIKNHWEFKRKSRIKFIGCTVKSGQRLPRRHVWKGDPYFLFLVSFFSPNHLFPDYTYKILLGVPLVIWLLFSQMSCIYFSRFCIFQKLNTKFSRFGNRCLNKLFLMIVHCTLQENIKISMRLLSYFELLYPLDR